jgi:hypothetical protein
MKRVLTGSFMAAAFAVGLSAQTTPPQTPPTTPPSSPSSPSSPSQSSQDRDSKNITVTGCLKAGDSADSFTLSDLKWGGSKGSGAVGTSGATGGGAPAGMASATTLTIKPSASTKLSEHVGHQVEVTGSVSDSAKSSSTSTTPADPAARPSSASGPTIEARSVRMVSATCSGQ